MVALYSIKSVLSNDLLRVQHIFGKDTSVPGVRREDQVLINFLCDKKFIEEMDAAVAKAGLAGRSQLIRDAIHDKLSQLGISVPESLKAPPPRAGRKPRATRKPS